MRQTFLSSPLFFITLFLSLFSWMCVYFGTLFIAQKEEHFLFRSCYSVCTRERANLIWAFSSSSSSSMVVTEDWLRWKEAGENGVIWPFKKGLNLCCSSSIQLGPFYCQLSALSFFTRTSWTSLFFLLSVHSFPSFSQVKCRCCRSAIRRRRRREGRGPRNLTSLSFTSHLLTLTFAYALLNLI